MKKIVITAACIMLVLTAGFITFLFINQNGASSAEGVSQLKMGEKYLSELNYEQAVATLENVIEIEPNNAEGYLSLAKAYSYMGDIDSANETLQNGYEATDSQIIKNEIDRRTENTQPDDTVETNQNYITIADRSYLADTKELVLRNCELKDEDLAKIAEFTELERLDISDNDITDISPLSSLTKLKKFYAANNSISDLSPLSNLAEIEYIGLRNNNISDADPVMQLDKLKYLHLGGNQINSLSSIADSIILLYLDGNKISSIKNLSSANLIYCDIQ